MRFLISGPLHSEYFENPNEVVGGIEMIVQNMLQILYEGGHEVHINHVGNIHKDFRKFATFHKMQGIGYDEMRKNSTKGQILRNSKRQTKELLSIFGKFENDGNTVFVNHSPHSNGLGVAVEISKYIPTFHMMHATTIMLPWLSGLAKKYKKLLVNGAVLYGAEGLDRLYFRDFKKILKLNRLRGITSSPEIAEFSKVFLTHYSLSYVPFDEVLLTGEILESSNEILQIGRISKLDTCKKFLPIAKTGENLTFYMSGDHPTHTPRILAMDHINVKLNAPRSELVDNLKTCCAVVLANPGEASGITAVEAVVSGALPIVFVKNHGDIHGSESFTNSVTDLAPERIYLEDDDWKVKFHEAIVYCKSINHQQRLEIAHKAREVFSHKSWLEEFVRVCSDAKCNEKVFNVI